MTEERQAERKTVQKTEKRQAEGKLLQQTEQKQAERKLTQTESKGQTETEADWEWFCSIPGIYHAHQEILLKVFGSPAAVRKAGAKEWEIFQRKGCRWIQKVQDFQKRYSADGIVNARAEKGIQFISHEHTMFPERLRMIDDCPYGLFFRGTLPEKERKAVAIIGARMCTREGKQLAELLAERVTDAGGEVISGAAYGIDGAAQWAAVQAGGKSYAVLGCGADVCYPSSHQYLLERLSESGGVISELPCGQPPLRSHFPMRNRLISGLSDVVAVIEAKKRSGSLITAEFAAEQGRQVLAVPGRPGDELSEGCNELIAQGAGLILSADSFVKTIFPDYKYAQKENSENLILASTEKLVYSSLDLHPKSLWEIQEKTSLTLGSLSDSLVSLEQKGLIRETGWNYFMKMK